MVIPCWIRDEDVPRAEVSSAEYGGEMVCACSCDGLNTCYILLRGDLRTEEEVSGFCEKFGVSGDWEVFVVDLLVVEGFFGLGWRKV